MICALIHQEELMLRDVQVVLQGGGARLSDLIAVGEVLDELRSAEKINITRVAGTSAGSIVACMLASGIPMSHFKGILQREAPKALKGIFLASFKPIIYWRIIRGRPILSEDVFRRLLETLFTYQNRRYRSFAQLSVPAYVVTTNLRDSTREVHGLLRNEDNFISAIVDSCSLPFAFRTYREKDRSVDGGICANLPGQELIDDLGRHDPILGISFEKNEDSKFPSKLFEYACSLLFTAMDNSVRAAKDQIEKNGGSVFLINSKTKTFDFAKAIEDINGSTDYELVKARSKEWVESKISDPRWLTKSRFSGDAKGVGLSAIYKRREQAADDIIADIRTSRSSCRIYAGTGLPELFDANVDQFTDALAEAAIKHSKQVTTPSQKYRFVFTCLDWWSVDTGPKELLDLWAKREHPTLPRSHYKNLTNQYFDEIVKRTAEKVIERLTGNGRRLYLEGALDYIEIEHRVFKDYPCPRAMCVVDDIVYIGMYEWEHAHGTPNPAFRLDPSRTRTTDEGVWTRVFLSEVEKIDRDYSKKGLDVRTIITGAIPTNTAPP
jgi:predicted acylesterase/phospholipase RssA